MNIPNSVLDLLLSSYRYGDSPMFLRESGEVVSYKCFVDCVLSISSVLRSIPNRYVGIAAVDPVLYAEGYLAAIVTGHIACLEQINTKKTRPLQNKLTLIDDDILHASYSQPLPISELPDINPGNPCTVAMSSGTVSGCRRLAALSQTALLYDTAYSMKYYRYHYGKRCVHILPYWHMFGIIAELFAPLFSGVTVCLPDSAYSFFRSIKKFQPHFLQMTPAIATQLASRIAYDNFQSITGGRLQKVLLSGAPISRKTCSDLTTYGVKVCTAYGLTECAPCVSIMPEWDIHPETCGKPLDCLHIDIADDKEILVKGATVMCGYVSADGIIENDMSDGWLHTGDIGYIDGNGYLTVTGRKSNILAFANGEKCLPEQVEEDISCISNVVECMLGVCGEDADQIPLLTVVYEDVIPDKASIDNVMADAGLPVYRYMVQREPLKRNAMGKLIRI